MSTHINAPDGAVAKAILLPGDPLRAKFIAENFLENAECYNEVRGMYGYTGTYKGKRISVQGTGMGQPSMSIYATELFHHYQVQTAIRIGTCGVIAQNVVDIRDLILVNAACSDSAILTQRFGCLHFAPAADFELLVAAHNAANNLGLKHFVGECVSNDLFYDENNYHTVWEKYGVLGVEMETAELYTLAAKYRRKALSILTVSDNPFTNVATTAAEREKTFTDMMSIALETAVQFA